MIRKDTSPPKRRESDPEFPPKPAELSGLERELEHCLAMQRHERDKYFAGNPQGRLGMEDWMAEWCILSGAWGPKAGTVC